MKNTYDLLQVRELIMDVLESSHLSLYSLFFQHVTCIEQYIYSQYINSLSVYYYKKDDLNMGLHSNVFM